VVDYIAEKEAIMLNLSSTETIAELEKIFTQKLNYTELLVWESSHLNYTTNRVSF